MLTKEIREWINKVKRGEYSYDDAMHELARFSRFITIDEMKLIKSKIKESYISKI
jgi:hypothetical protein